MKHEQQTTGRPEYFREAQTLDEVLREYAVVTNGLVRDHQEMMGTIVRDHDAVFVKANNNPSSVDIKEEMESTQDEVASNVGQVSHGTEGVIMAVAEVIPTMLDEDSNRILQEAQSTAATFGIESRMVRDVISRAPRRTQAAIRASLDVQVFRSVLQQVSTSGVESRLIADTIRFASSDKVQAAIRASLDAEVFDSLETHVSYFGPDSFASDTIRFASTRIVAKVFESKLFEWRTKASQQEREQESSRQRTYREDFRAEDVYGDHFRTGSQRRGRATPPPSQPRAEASQPNRDTEVEQIIETVATRNRRFSWISTEKPEDIRRIINTVKKLREKAEAEGTELSDRQVYLKYRAAAETNPRFVKSVQIIEALMDGDINGELPF